MGSSQLMCTDTLDSSRICGGVSTSSMSPLNSHRYYYYCHMHFPLNVFSISNAFAACLWVSLLLLAPTATYSVTSADPFESFAVSSDAYAHSTRFPAVHHNSKAATFPDKPSVLTSGHAIRISTSDLQRRLALERTIQLAAFQQFGSHRTGRLYNVSATGLLPENVRAIRLRSGSFRRYGVNINELIIPQGCIVNPIPERILLVYARYVDTSLFQEVQDGFFLASPVVSVLVYNAGNLTSEDVPQQLSVSITASRISLRLPQILDDKCAEFAGDSTAVNFTEPIGGVCQVDHLGTFAVVRSGIMPAPSPSREQSPMSSQGKHSNTWKIVVGSVVGGLALLVFVSLLALGIGKRRRDSKLSRMEYHAEQGETLQMATVRNSRVPAAANTRTQATLVNDYSV